MLKTKNRLVASLIALIMILNLVTIPAGVQAAGDPTLKIEVEKSNYDVNEIFIAQVKVSDVTFNASQITVYFNPAVVQVVDEEGNEIVNAYHGLITNTDHIGESGSSDRKWTYSIRDINKEKGLVDVAIHVAQDIVNQYAVTTEEDYVGIRFKAIADGDPNIHFATATSPEYTSANSYGYVFSLGGVDEVMTLIVPTILVGAPITYVVTVDGDATETTDYIITGASNLGNVVTGTDLKVTAVTDITVNGEDLAADANKIIKINAATTITINKPLVGATGVTLDKATLGLTVGTTETLIATVVPGDATNKTVVWTSADTGIATVANGVVTPVDAGTTTITVTTDDGSHTATCNVTVIKADQAAPSGLAGVAPTSAADDDGKITGTTTEMEYKLASATDWISVTATEITGLAAGDYVVRYKAKIGYNAGTELEVAVTAYVKSDDATLSDLTLDGTTVEGFASDIFTYNVELPARTTELPTIVATTTHDKAVTVTTAVTTPPGAATVVVTAEDGTTTKTYTINFTVVIDKSNLISAIEDANTNKGTVTVSTDGSEVFPTDKWVKEAEMSAYTTAIETAVGVRDAAASTQAAVDTAVTTLATATTTFNNAKKDGTKPVTLESIAITTPASKLVYTVGETLDITGLVVTGTYSDESTKIETIEATDITGFDSSAVVASQTLTITVDGKTATYTVEIKEADKSALNEAIADANINKGTVTVSTDGSEVFPTDNWVTETEMLAYTTAISTAQGVASNSASTQAEVNAAVSALGTATSTFNTAKKDGTKPVTLESIAITTPASKLVYTVGETLDITGLVVTGTYNDESTKVESITTENVSGFDSSATVESLTLTVTVGEKTATYAIKVVPPYVPPTKYIIITIAGEGGRFDTDKKVTVQPGKNAQFNILPNEGYEIEDVKIDGISIGAVSSYEFVKVVSNHNIYATFKEVEDTMPNFIDVTEDDWYYESVMEACKKGWLIGTSDITFSPNIDMSRAMLVTVLWRMEGEPVAKPNDFTDVMEDIYYTAAIDWASEKGIISGYGNDLFKPDEGITREQIVTILHRYAQYKGYNTAQEGTGVGTFADYEDISEYALLPMEWAVKAGLLQGDDNNKLMPQDKGSRAQVAAMLTRFGEKIME